MITKPDTNSLTGYMAGYISQAEGNDLVQSLRNRLEETSSVYRSIMPEMEEYRYDTGKWSIKEVLGHIVDTERIFTYRALTFARKDNSRLPGYDQDAYVPYSNAANRKLADILKEYEAVRMSTIYLFESFNPEMLDSNGIANNLNVTPRVLGWMAAGHDAHHYKVLKEKYLI